jgi:N-glycosylase/DNA lyase
MRFSLGQIQAAIDAVYSEIEQSAVAMRAPALEEDLWQELACCVLSSQVPYPLAQAVASAIREDSLLAPLAPVDEGAYTARLSEILHREFIVDGRARRYRFPNSKARQLAATRRTILETFGTLSAGLAAFDGADEARLWFVTHAPGLGPKQASMFLRNCRDANDLAIIDRHVLRYMELAGLTGSNPNGPTGYLRYVEDEIALRRHSRAKGYILGWFDYAVWVVMRLSTRFAAEGCA